MIRRHKKVIFSQQGFSLIEALVAFLILSVGMLGIASLQMISLKAGHTATLRTIAVIKTEEMFERIRNNPLILNPDVGGSYNSSITDPGDNNNCNDYGSGQVCDMDDMARDDIYNWKENLGASLPNTGVTASIVVEDKVVGVMPTATVTITINWLERNTETQAMDTMKYSVSAHICDNTGC